MTVMQSTEELTIEEAVIEIQNNNNYFSGDYPFVKTIGKRKFFICKDGILEAKEIFYDCQGFQDIDIHISNTFRAEDMCLLEEEILIIKEEADKKVQGFNDLIAHLDSKSQ